MNIYDTIVVDRAHPERECVWFENYGGQFRPVRLIGVCESELADALAANQLAMEQAYTVFNEVRTKDPAEWSLHEMNYVRAWRGLEPLQELPK